MTNQPQNSNLRDEWEAELQDILAGWSGGGIPLGAFQLDARMKKLVLFIRTLLDRQREELAEKVENLSQKDYPRRDGTTVI